MLVHFQASSCCAAAPHGILHAETRCFCLWFHPSSNTSSRCTSSRSESFPTLWATTQPCHVAQIQLHRSLCNSVGTLAYKRAPHLHLHLHFYHHIQKLSLSSFIYIYIYTLPLQVLALGYSLRPRLKMAGLTEVR